MAQKTNILALLGALSIAACGPIVDLGGSAGPADRLFVLEGASVRSAIEVSEPVIIFVEDPVADGEISSDRLAVILDGGEVRYLGGARWADRPSRLVRQHVRDELNSVTGVTALARGNLNVPSDFRLKLHVRSFNVRDRGMGDQDAVVEIDAWLMDQDSTLKGAKTFRASAPTNPSQPGTVVSNLGSALSSASNDLVNWAVSLIQAQADT